MKNTVKHLFSGKFYVLILADFLKMIEMHHKLHHYGLACRL